MTLTPVHACLLALAGSAAVLAGGETPAGGGVGWNAGFLGGIPGDALAVAAMPGGWTGGDWAVAGGALGLGVALYASDPAIDRWMRDHRNAATDRVSSAVKPFGREYLAAGLVATAGVSLAVDDPRVRRSALLGGEALVFAFVGHTAITTAAGRRRPDAEEGRSSWAGPGRGDSFPSGHTTAAFAVATVFAHEWSDIPGAAPGAYALASLVALSRVNDRAHWASDVFVGALLGWAMGTAVETLHPADRPARVAVTPWWDGRNGGMDIAWRF